MVPHEGGLSVIRALRENLPELLRRVIVITGAPTVMAGRNRSEVFAVIAKPFDTSELLQVVKECAVQARAVAEV